MGFYPYSILYKNYKNMDVVSVMSPVGLWFAIVRFMKPKVDGAGRRHFGCTTPRMTPKNQKWAKMSGHGCGWGKTWYIFDSRLKYCFRGVPGPKTLKNPCCKRPNITFRMTHICCINGVIRLHLLKRLIYTGMFIIKLVLNTLTPYLSIFTFWIMLRATTPFLRAHPYDVY